MKEDAKLMVTGEVVQVSKRNQRKGISSVDTLYTYRIRVERVHKGNPEWVGQDVEVETWGIKSRPRGWVGPSGLWGAASLQKGSKVTVHLRGGPEQWRVLTPNGLTLEDGDE
ncbi:MAG: hypothetical protein AAF357_01450 [Verrucomicrobiota bacterium]